MAVAHTLLVIVYHVLAEETDYQELGGNSFDERDRLAISCLGGISDVPQRPIPWDSYMPMFTPLDLRNRNE